MLDVLNQDLLVRLDLEVSKIEQLNELVAGRSVSGLELMVVVMEPLILLEVDHASLGLDCTLETPEGVLVDEQVHLGVSGRVHCVGHENSGDAVVVEILVDQVHLKLSVQWEEACDITH